MLPSKEEKEPTLSLPSISLAEAWHHWGEYAEITMKRLITSADAVAMSTKKWLKLISNLFLSLVCLRNGGED